MDRAAAKILMNHWRDKHLCQFLRKDAL